MPTEDIILDNELLTNHELQVIDNLLPTHLTILPLLQRPVFPGMTIPLTFSGKDNLNAIRRIVEKENGFAGLVYAKEWNSERVFESELYEVGTAFQIYRVQPIAPEVVQVIGQGIARFKKKE